MRTPTAPPADGPAPVCLRSEHSPSQSRLRNIQAQSKLIPGKEERPGFFSFIPLLLLEALVIPKLRIAFERSKNNRERPALYHHLSKSRMSV